MELAISLTNDCQGLFKALWGSYCQNLLKAKKESNVALIKSIKYDRKTQKWTQLSSIFRKCFDMLFHRSINDLSCQTTVQIYLLRVFGEALNKSSAWSRSHKAYKPHNPTWIPESCLGICKASKLRGKEKKSPYDQFLGATQTRGQLTVTRLWFRVFFLSSKRHICISNL